MTSNANIAYFCHRSDLRHWLEKNANTQKELWIKSTRSANDNNGLYYLDIVEEALCFGWIDSTCKRMDDGCLFQRISPRKKNSNWSELNKERCRRLIKLRLMTPEGKKALPSLAKNSFKMEKWLSDILKSDRIVWKNMKSFPELYVIIRLYNIQWYEKNLSHEKAMKYLETFINATRTGKMYGAWNDGGRLLNY